MNSIRPAKVTQNLQLWLAASFPVRSFSGSGSSGVAWLGGSANKQALPFDLGRANWSVGVIPSIQSPNFNTSYRQGIDPAWNLTMLLWGVDSGGADIVTNPPVTMSGGLDSNRNPIAQFTWIDGVYTVHLANGQLAPIGGYANPLKGPFVPWGLRWQVFSSGAAGFTFSMTLPDPVIFIVNSNPDSVG